MGSLPCDRHLNSATDRLTTNICTKQHLDVSSQHGLVVRPAPAASAEESCSSICSWLRAAHHRTGKPQPNRVLCFHSTEHNLKTGRRVTSPKQNSRTLMRLQQVQVVPLTLPRPKLWEPIFPPHAAISEPRSSPDEAGLPHPSRASHQDRVSSASGRSWSSRNRDRDRFWKFWQCLWTIEVVASPRDAAADCRQRMLLLPWP